MALGSGKKEQIIERRRLIMLERLKFKSLAEITQWWNETYPDQPCSRTQIGRDIQASVQESIRETALATLEWRQLHIDRIEAVLGNKEFQAKMEKADLFAIDRFDKLMGRLILLTGANAPTKITQTDVTGEKNMTQLSDDERFRLLEELIKNVRERQSLQDGVHVVDADVVADSRLLEDFEE